MLKKLKYYILYKISFGNTRKKFKQKYKELNERNINIINQYTKENSLILSNQIQESSIQIINNLNNNVYILSELIKELKEKNNIIRCLKDCLTYLEEYANKLDETDSGILTVDEIKFKKITNLFGLAEIFGRRDYEFSDIGEYVFIDAGANIGDSALYISKQNNCKKVYAYEPFKQVYKLACENINLNPDLTDKIEIFNCGLSSKNERMNIPVSDDINMSPMNTMCEFFYDKVPIYKNVFEEIELKSTSEELKRILQENPGSKIVFKMDIEGSEYDCIEDLNRNDMFKYIDIILMEWHFKGYETIFEILQKNGFVCFNEKFQPEVGFIRAVNMNSQKCTKEKG